MRRQVNRSKLRCLRKTDVERLLTDFDRDPIGALTVAVTWVLQIDNPGWSPLIELCDLPADRAAALRRGDQVALDELLRDLNELRVLPGRGDRLTGYSPPTAPITGWAKTIGRL